jgi:penicillin amidase
MIMIKKILFSLLLVVGAIALAIHIYLFSKHPEREGELILDGLNESVVVSYDLHGIPHLKANSDADLYRAFGYVHAQDRLFQMEMSRRLSQGQLSEVIGERTLATDKLFRTLGLHRFAHKWIAAVKRRADPKMIEIMESYLEGVNAYVKQGDLPSEFALLGIEPHHYTLEDMASIAGYISLSFAVGLRDDPMTHHLSQKLGENYLKDLGVKYTPGFEQIPVDPKLTERVATEISSLVESLQSSGLFHGSNSWLVAPDRSESGKAMLVNDPHIAFSQPSVWYEAQLTSPTTEIYGHFLGLVPLPLLGMTEQHAWGLTMFENDDMDLYAEKVNPKDPSQYWAVDGWKKFEQVDEVINVKGEQAVTLAVKISRHGPVINDIYQGINKGQFALGTFEAPLALWWAYLNTDNQMIEAFYQLPTAFSLDKAREAASMIHAPGLNLMYANASGDIAWWASAKLPIRPEHVNSKMILDGSSGDDDIIGYYDFSENPQQENPPSGVIYTANNQPADRGTGLVPGYYSPTDRPTRILSKLSEKEKFNPEDMKKMLLDNVSPTGQLMQQVAGSILVSNKAQLSSQEQKALHYFLEWDGAHSPDSVGATLYNRLKISLMRLAMEDEMGEALYSGFEFGFFMKRSIWKILDRPESLWWDNLNTEELETREMLVVQAWRETVALLTKKYGNDSANWRWGIDIQTVHQHPLGQNAVLGRLYNVGPFESNAGPEVINNLKLTANGDDLKVMMGPSTRRVIDFGDIENSWGINPSGQSGVVTDEHYDDQALDYSLGNFRHQYMTKNKVDRHLKSRLVLTPSAP